jgi:2-haloalkanoic acid dehalogenase type II
MQKKYEAIIFDIHKTLIDDSGFPKYKFLELLEKDGEKIDKATFLNFYDKITKQIFNWSLYKDEMFMKVKEMHIRRLAVLYRRFHFKRNFTKDSKYLIEKIGESDFYPEAIGVLKAIKEKYKLALVSNADNDDPLIKKVLNLDIKFDVVVISESVRAYKPDGKIFDSAIEQLGVDKEKILLVGDSPLADVFGAKNTGMDVVWVNREKKVWGYSDFKPDYEISNLNGLIEILELE